MVSPDASPRELSLLRQWCLQVMCVCHVMHVYRTEVPIIVVLKAMGVESDQEAITLVGPEPGLAALLAPSLEEAVSTLEIYSQMQALEYLCKNHSLPSPDYQLLCLPARQVPS